MSKGDDMKKHITVGDMARAEGLAVETIRYYEREGLIPRPCRTASGHRAYSPEDLKTLAFIRRARDLGFSIKDTRALLAFRHGETCEEVLEIASRHLDGVRSKLRQLVELEMLLSEAIKGCPGGKTANCPLLKNLEGGVSKDRFAARQGSGDR